MRSLLPVGLAILSISLLPGPTFPICSLSQPILFISPLFSLIITKPKIKKNQSKEGSIEVWRSIVEVIAPSNLVAMKRIFEVVLEITYKIHEKNPFCHHLTMCFSLFLYCFIWLLVKFVVVT